MKFAKKPSQPTDNAILTRGKEREERLPNDPVIVGILAVLCASTLKGKIEQTYRDVLGLGHEILRKQEMGMARAVGGSARAGQRQ